MPVNRYELRRRLLNDVDAQAWFHCKIMFKRIHALNIWLAHLLF